MEKGVLSLDPTSIFLVGQRELQSVVAYLSRTLVTVGENDHLEFRNRSPVENSIFCGERLKDR